MITEYTPVSWAPGEPVTIDKLNAMAQNTQLLFEKTPKTLYNAFGISKDKGIKVLAMSATVPANSKSGNATARVYFGNFFSVGCQPMIAVAPISYPQGRYHVTVCGHGPVIPDHRGCALLIAADELNVKNNKISKTMYVNIVAVGW